LFCKRFQKFNILSVPSTKKIVKLRTVAEKAGVSIATVSRVINAHPDVKANTRLAVQNAIRVTGYRPNRVAQRLRSTTKSRKLIGLLIPDIENPFYVDIIRGIEDVAYQHGSAVVIGNFSQDQKREKMYIDLLKSEFVDGFIVAPTSSNDKYVEELIKEGWAVVCIDRGLTKTDADTVKSDNETGAYRATEHLIKLGHKRIAFISGDPSIQTTLERIQGYKTAMKKYGIEISPELIKGIHSDFASGKEITAELLALPQRPTAIFTGNNLLTLGCLETLHQQKISIPSDIALVGFDDMYWANSLNPALTAVRQQGKEIGKSAIKLLYERIEDIDKVTVNYNIKTELIVRKSCGFE